MHYKNGREAKVGDQVLVTDYNEKFIGVVVDTSSTSTTCNLKVIPLPLLNYRTATAGECQHIEDAIKV